MSARTWWHEVLFWIGHPRGMADHCRYCQLRARRIRYLSAQLRRTEAQRDALAALVAHLAQLPSTSGKLRVPRETPGGSP